MLSPVSSASAWQFKAQPAQPTAQTWDRFGQALNESKNVAQEVQPQDLCSRLINWACATESEQASFAKQVLKELLVFALTGDQEELRYADCEGNDYVIKKEEGKVSLTKQTAAYLKESSHNLTMFNTGFECYFGGKLTTLYQLDIQELQQAHEAVLKSNNGHHSDSALFSLLNNNQSVTRQLAEHIIDKYESFPPGMVKLAKRYVWQANKHELPYSYNLWVNDNEGMSNKEWNFYPTKQNKLREECHSVRDRFEGNSVGFYRSYDNPDFDPKMVWKCIKETDLLLNPNLTSISFRSLRFSPQDIKEIVEAVGKSDFITKLSFRYCKLTIEHAHCMASALANNSSLKVFTDNNNNNNPLADDLMRNFRKVTPLEFDVGNQNEFRIKCDFARNHFKGDSVGFYRRYGDSKCDPKMVWKCIKETDLLLNPNLTSISFESLGFSPQDIKEIAETVGESDSITALSFKDCSLDDEHAHCLADALATNSGLKVLNLKDNYIGVDGTLALVDNTTITSLDIRNNDVSVVAGTESNFMGPPNKEPLLEALKKNLFLTSFNVDIFLKPDFVKIKEWPQCKQYLLRNRNLPHSRALYQNLRLLSYSETTSNWPVEVLQLIFSMGIAAMKERC